MGSDANKKRTRKASDYLDWNGGVYPKVGTLICQQRGGEILHKIMSYQIKPHQTNQINQAIESFQVRSRTPPNLPTHHCPSPRNNHCIGYLLITLLVMLRTYVCDLPTSAKGRKTRANLRCFPHAEVGR